MLHLFICDVLHPALAAFKMLWCFSHACFAADLSLIELNLFQKTIILIFLILYSQFSIVL